MELKDEGLRLKWMERRWEIQLSIKWVDLEEKREKNKEHKEDQQNDDQRNRK